MANSRRTCTYKPCRAPYRPAEGIIHPSGKFGWCGEECRIKWAAANAPKFKQKAEKEFKAETRRRKKVMLADSLPHQKKLTQDDFNTMIRWLDRGKRCPTCGEPIPDGEGEAGHVRTVAACPQLRYDARGCFLQCRPCNGSGTIRRRAKKTQEVVSELYKAWILETHGQKYYDWLYGPHASPDYDCATLKEMRGVFTAETRRLKDGLGPSRQWRALTIE